MLFRGRQPAATVWRRFRAGADEFTFAAVDGHYEARVATNAERAVDLLYVLSEQLPPAVELWLEDVRGARAWRGTDVGLPDVREAIARLKVPLAAYGGVELSVYSAEDQIALSTELALYAYARTDRWLYILQSKGLVQTETPEPETYALAPDELGEAPELTDALDAAADRLGLDRVGAV